MRVIESTLVVFFLLGVFLKLYDIPGGAAMIGSSLLGLSLLYVLFNVYVFKGSYKKISLKTLGVSVFNGFILAIICTAIWIDLLGYQGREHMIIAGMALGIFSLSLLILYFNKVVHSSLYRQILLRLIPCIVVVTLLFMIPKETKYKLVYPKYFKKHDHPYSSIEEYDYKIIYPFIVFNSVVQDSIVYAKTYLSSNYWYWQAQRNGKREYVNAYYKISYNEWDTEDIDNPAIMKYDTGYFNFSIKNLDSQFHVYVKFDVDLYGDSKIDTTCIYDHLTHKRLLLRGFYPTKYNSVNPYKDKSKEWILEKMK